MAVIITAPETFEIPEYIDHTAVFLAGSIDNGIAPDWQKTVLAELKDLNVLLLNPRRSDWNPLAGPSEIREQVNWELNAIEYADHVIMYIAEGSKAPISLLELGLLCQDNRLMVAAHPTYYRRVNVEVICEKYNVPLFDSLDKLIKAIKYKLTQE